VTQTQVEDLMKKCVKPRLPEDDECCGSGCATCVFDIYDTKMEKYEDTIAEYEGLLLEFEESD
jgi:hypothetical protein